MSAPARQPLHGQLFHQRSGAAGVHPYRLALRHGISHLEHRAGIGLLATERVHIGHDQITFAQQCQIGPANPAGLLLRRQIPRHLLVERIPPLVTILVAQHFELFAVSDGIRPEDIETGEIDGSEMPRDNTRHARHSPA